MSNIIYLEILINILIILMAIAYLVFTTVLQARLSRKKKIYVALLLPAITSTIVYIGITNINLFLILMFIIFAYYMLVFFYYSRKKIETKNEKVKVNIKDL